MKKIYNSLLIILAITSFSGCKKFLETAPDQRTQLNTPEKVAELLATAYAQADYVTFAEAASDNSEDKGVNVGDIAVENQDAYLWKDVNGRDTGTPTYFWNESYKAIAAANQALEAINGMADQTLYRPYKGEALVARAYAHFMLAVFFAKPYDAAGSNDSPGIPYVTTPEKVVFGQYTRGTVASTYAAIEKDLLEGLPLLKDNAYKVPKYHFNQAAANAFAARFFLFKKEYNKVVSYATAAAPSGAFLTVLRPWNTRYYAASANEFRIAFTQAAEPANLLITEAQSVWARNQAFYRYGMGLTLNVASYQPNVTGKSFDSEKVLNYGAPNYTLYKYLELFIRTSPNATIGFPYTIMIQFTTDETLLNRAEAYANLGQNDLALADLNTFASTRLQSYNAATYGVTLAKVASFYRTADVKVGLVNTVLDFKKQEFAQEGLRWLDIVRLGLTVRHNIKAVNNSDTYVTLEPTDPRRLFQLPSEVKLSGVEQNPR